MQNGIDASMTATDQDKILENFVEIKTLLLFLIDLSPEGRCQLPRVCNKSRVNESYFYF